MFKSLEEVKAVAEKFEAGKIVPRRVLNPEGRSEKKIRHKIKFTRNVYRLLGKGNEHVFLVDYNESGRGDNVFIHADLSRHTNLKINLNGASHGKSGNHFICNYRVSDDKCLRLINQAVFGKMAAER